MKLRKVKEKNISNIWYKNNEKQMKLRKVKEKNISHIWYKTIYLCVQVWELQAVCKGTNSDITFILGFS